MPVLRASATWRRWRPSWRSTCRAASKSCSCRIGRRSSAARRCGGAASRRPPHCCIRALVHVHVQVHARPARRHHPRPSGAAAATVCGAEAHVRATFRTTRASHHEAQLDITQTYPRPSLYLFKTRPVNDNPVPCHFTQQTRGLCRPRFTTDPWGSHARFACALRMRAFELGAGPKSGPIIARALVGAMWRT
eukprot:scaffold5394_cov274-Prasinococcus_capsulatus_cf.AAC.3